MDLTVPVKLGLVQLPPGSEVTDADDEVFFLYTNLQLGSADAGTSQGYHGLGHVDSRKDTLRVRFELKGAPSDTTTVVKRYKGAKKDSKRHRQRDEVVEIDLAQDKTALRTRKGDTGSVLWMASVEFAQLVLQQFHNRLEDSLLNRKVLADSHVLELGAGTGLLGIVFAPLVRQYTVTDLAVLLPLVCKNIALNYPDWREPTKPGSNISVQELDWTAIQNATPTFRSRLLPSGDAIDLILVVDCIYHPSLLPGLVETIDSLAVPERTAVLVVAELRAEDVVRVFLELWLAKGGWSIWRAESGLMGRQHAVWVGWKRGP